MFDIDSLTEREMEILMNKLTLRMSNIASEKKKKQNNAALQWHRRKRCEQLGITMSEYEKNGIARGRPKKKECQNI